MRLGLSRSTLWRYVKAGLIEPDLVTAGGHFQFDPEHVRRQLRALQQRGDG
jgi:DNA-binding transcriptional MerR regulator